VRYPARAGFVVATLRKTCWRYVFLDATYLQARVNHRLVSQEAGGAAGVVARWSYAPPVTTQCQLLVALRLRGCAAPYRQGLS
jgi:hypothetical protein